MIGSTARILGDLPAELALNDNKHVVRARGVVEQREEVGESGVQFGESLPMVVGLSAVGIKTAKVRGVCLTRHAAQYERCGRAQL